MLLLTPFDGVGTGSQELGSKVLTFPKAIVIKGSQCPAVRSFLAMISGLCPSTLTQALEFLF